MAMRGLLAILILFTISTFSFTYASEETSDDEKASCFFEAKWHLLVTNDINWDIAFKVRSEGTNTIPYQSTFDWTFCDGVNKVVPGDFWWGTIHRRFNLFDDEVWKICHNPKVVTQHCYWMVPQRLYTLNELKLNGIETSSLLSPKDNTLGSIERNLQIAALLGFISAWSVFDLGPEELLYFSLGIFFLWTLDTVAFAGGFSSLVLDTIGHNISRKYHDRVIQHEAGHFLIAYLLGILPKGYTLSSLEAFQREGSLNVQAGTVFVDFEFNEEISSGRVSAKMLNRFSCIALAGVATEYLLYGYAEGGLADVNTLDRLLNSLGFTQKNADSQVRWAVLNTILILRRHEKARTHLANAMSEGKSVGSCIDVIEKNIDEMDLMIS